MSLPFHRESRPDGEPDTEARRPQFSTWPNADPPIVEDEQHFFVEWEVPQAS